MWITDTAKESPGPPKISAAGFNSFLLSRDVSGCLGSFSQVVEE